jgi:hypothetical protein
MRHICLAFVFVCAVSTSVTAQSKLKDRIPAPKEKVYRSVLSGEDWKNPVLGVNEDGVVRMKTGNDYAAAAVIVPVTEALSWLELLPPSAWPYGRVVAVQEAGACCHSPDGDAKRIAIRLELVKRLRREGIVVWLWPQG